MRRGLPTLVRMAAAPTVLFMADPSVNTWTSSSAFSDSLMESSLLLAMLVPKGSSPWIVRSLATVTALSIYQAFTQLSTT